jgi:nucleotide-binding universal stress UspA family protein
VIAALDILCSSDENKGVRVERRVRRGHPADENVAAVRETGADLIAMSTKVHALSEEEILHPAALLVSDCIKARLRQ